MKKRRRIRWDRVTLLVVLFVSIVGSITFGIIKILDIQKQNRKSIKVDLTVDNLHYELNGDEYLKYVKYNELPEVETLPLVITTPIEEVVEEEPKLIDLGEFRLTGYCNCEICCGVWAGGPCYNGEMPESEWTIAVDTDVIPLNSYVIINGHKYKACDTGSAIIGNRIDIYCDTHQECYSEYCNGYAEVYLIEE